MYPPSSIALIDQTLAGNRQGALAEKVGLAVLRLDYPAYPEKQFRLAYGEQISLNGPGLAKGAIIRTLHTAHIKAVLIQADETIPYSEIRGCAPGREAAYRTRGSGGRSVDADAVWVRYLTVGEIVVRFVF